MSQPVMFETSRAIPEAVYRDTGPSKYEIDLTGFEAKLVGLSLLSVSSMVITSGASSVSDVSDPVLNIASLPHTVSWTMWEKSEDTIGGDIWFETSDNQAICLSWRVKVVA